MIYVAFNLEDVKASETSNECKIYVCFLNISRIKNSLVPPSFLMKTNFNFDGAFLMGNCASYLWTLFISKLQRLQKKDTATQRHNDTTTHIHSSFTRHTLPFTHTQTSLPSPNRHTNKNPNTHKHTTKPTHLTHTQTHPTQTHTKPTHLTFPPPIPHTGPQGTRLHLHLGVRKRWQPPGFVWLRRLRQQHLHAVGGWRFGKRQQAVVLGGMYVNLGHHLLQWRQLQGEEDR